MINLLRIVAIELGTWRSVLGGGASGSVTFGNGKFFELSGVTEVRGGNPLPLGDQKSVGRDAQRGMVVEAAPASSSEMSEPDLLFELLIIALDLPTQFGEVHELAEGNVSRQGRKPHLAAFPPLRAIPSTATLRAGFPRVRNLDVRHEPAREQSARTDARTQIERNLQLP